MDDRFAFLVEWYDPCACLIRRYQLYFFPGDRSVEMYDVKNQRTFLKRISYPELRLEDLFIGNRVTVLSRQLTLIDYGNPYTANTLGSKKEKTLALIKPDALRKIGEIIQAIYDFNLIITKAKMIKLSLQEASDFYSEYQSRAFFNNLLHFMTSGPIVAMELMGNESVSVWRNLLGPNDPDTARIEASHSIRARNGTDLIRNTAHGSDSPASAAKELEFFFPFKPGCGFPNTAKLSDCTCCIIKPHAVAEGLTGKILTAITEAGFEISALQMFIIERANAEEFLEVYKGVVVEYPNMVTELCSGPCVVLEIHGPDVLQTFRELCGPADPEMGRALRPNTLRARFGKDKVQNAVHCSDLPDDGVLEVQYFFKILDWMK